MAKKKSVKNYYAISSGIAAILSVFVHWVSLSDLDIHTTSHVAIGIGAFFVFRGILTLVIRRLF